MPEYTEHNSANQQLAPNNNTFASNTLSNNTPGNTFEGHLLGSGLRFGLVVGRFNELISERLLQGALAGLRRHGVILTDVDVAWVPGSFEIPLAAKRMAASGRYHAICCLGAVIRGGTPHFDYVAGQVAAGVAQASLSTDVPVIFGVLTTDTIEQALERSGTKAGNKGYDAALAAIDMAHLLHTLPPAATPAAISSPPHHRL